MADSSESQPPEAAERPPRRSFFSAVISFFMAFGLASGYGMFAALAGRYLYPAKSGDKNWMFVTDLAGLAAGSSILYRAPAGQSVSIARLEENGTAEDFIALSSVCPHLGCQVHWEEQNRRFFCPCHNGVFTPEGVGSEGPPADAGQSLSRYPLKVENGLLFIEVPATSLG